MKKQTGHWIGWLIFIALILTFVYRESGTDAVKSLLIKPGFWGFVFFYVAIFYLNISWLLPTFFQKGRYLLYLVLSILCLAIVYVVSPFENMIFKQIRRERQIEIRSDIPPPSRPDHRFSPEIKRDNPPLGPGNRRNQGPNIDIISIMLWGIVWATGMFVATSRQWQKAEQAILQSQTDKANAELAFLKAQINPHFLFNTLSNLYSLATIKSDETASGILQLSNLMRYLVEESARETVQLAREVSFIENYIELQKLRLNEKTVVDFRVSDLKSDSVIAPMLLITFIENAFKYGISASKEVVILIFLKMEGNQLQLYCHNQISNKNSISESTGIGIRNTKSRLAHLYPNRHELTISEDERTFEVSLKIDLSVSKLTSRHPL